MELIRKLIVLVLALVMVGGSVAVLVFWWESGVALKAILLAGCGMGIFIGLGIIYEDFIEPAVKALGGKGGSAWNG